MNEKFVILVGIIPVFNNKILITQRSLKLKFLPGAWGLPCGKIEYGEELEDAVRRELYEETKLTGDIVKMVGSSKFIGIKDEVKLHNLQINYLVYLHNDNVVIDDSSESYKWIDLLELDDAKLDSFTISTIRQAYPL